MHLNQVNHIAELRQRIDLNQATHEGMPRILSKNLNTLFPGLILLLFPISPHNYLPKELNGILD